MESMKKSLIATGVAFSAVLAFSLFGLGNGGTLVAHADGANLIVNPSFEQQNANGTPVGWEQGSWGDASSAVFTYPVAGEDDNFAAQVSIGTYNGVGEGNGAAEWYFDNVPVTPNTLYDFHDWYQSNANSYLIAQWTLTDGSFAYDSITTLPPTASGTWTETPDELFTAPVNAVSVTVLHLLQSAGSLTIDNAFLGTATPSGQNTFPQGMVTLTFDDGYTSQYNNAFPILTKANVPGTFYIITSLIDTAPPDNLFDDSGVSTSTVTTTSTAEWDGLYTDPTYQNYVLSGMTMATAPATVQLHYLLNGTQTTQTLGMVPASAPKMQSINFMLPTNSDGTTVSPIDITMTLTKKGTLVVSQPSLVEYQTYMNVSDLLAMQAGGEEMDSHTETHPDLTALTVAEDTQEIAGSRTALINWGLAPVDTLAYPFGDYNTTIEGIVAGAGYAAARTVDVGYNDTAANAYALKSYSVVESTTLPQVETWINTAAQNHWWLILTFHDIDPANILQKNGEIYGTTPTMLQQIISYLKQNNIETPSMDQALSVWGK